MQSIQGQGLIIRNNNFNIIYEFRKVKMHYSMGLRNDAESIINFRMSNKFWGAGIRDLELKIVS